jgi:hypothetical protein
VKEQVILVFNIFKGFVIILASYIFFLTSLDIVVYLLFIFLQTSLPCLQKISPFPAPREEWKEGTKEETKWRQRGARGSLSSEQDIVVKKSLFLKFNNT